ncbi:zinc finger, CCHC-type containing protein, partial [Tanacetum coccineum]
FKHTFKYLKEELTLVESGSHLGIEESLRVQDSDKPKGNNVVSPSVVNMVKHNNFFRYNDNKGKRKHHDNTRADPNKKENPTCTKGSVDGSSNSLKGQNMFNKSLQVYYVTYVFEAYSVQDDDVAWCVDVDGSSNMIYLICTPSLENKKYFVIFIDDASRFCYVYLLHTKDEALDKFKVFKTEVELQQGSQIKRFKTNRGGEYMDTLYFLFVGIIHETTSPYTPQQNGISERKNKVLKEMVNSMLSYSGLSQGFQGEAILTACYLLNRAPNKRKRITLYELWTKRKPNLNYLMVWDCRAVVRLFDPKLKTLGERGIECIFVRYAEHSKAFRFFVIEPNESVSINSIIESNNVIFDENIFFSVPRPSLRIPNGTEDIGCSVVPKEVTEEVVQQPEPEFRKIKRNRTSKNFVPEFQLYLIEGTKDEVSDQHSNCFNVEDDPKIFDEAMKSQDVAFWKEAINDEMESIKGNTT